MPKRKKVDGIPTIAMPHVGKLTLVRGPAGCGKTHSLVEHVRELVAHGADPSSILVVCATPDAARSLSERLGMAEIHTLSACELALELLARPDAVALFGHGPRVLLPFEEDILFEDLKLSGIDVERLSGMLSFFKRSMTEISDDHPDFLMDDDELAVMHALRDNLHLRGAFLREQLSANAARYLNTVGCAFRYEHVCVDDLQHLNRGSQVMTARLARTSLYVTANPEIGTQVLDPYPYPAGIEELLAANKQADVIELDTLHVSVAVGHALNALRRDAGLPPCGIGGSSKDSATTGLVSIEVLRDADEEIGRVAGLVASSIHDGLSPADIFVVSPHSAWSSRIGTSLERQGVATLKSRSWRSLVQSDADTSTDGSYLKMLTALLLAGNPCDETAWRSWCAFDEPLAASGKLAAIAQAADNEGLQLHEALACTKIASQYGHLHRTYLEGITFLECCREQCGQDLLRHLTDVICGSEEPIPEPLLELCSPLQPNDTAAELRSRILARTCLDLGWNLTRPDETAEAVPAVHVGSMERLTGLAPRLMVFAGFVNGFFPPHSFFDQTITPPGDVDAARKSYVQTLGAALGKASESAVFTAFSKIPYAQAKQLGLKMDRIGLEKQERIARVSPSVLFDSIEVWA